MESSPGADPERGSRGVGQCGRPPPASPRTHSSLRKGSLCRPRDGGLSPSFPGAARLRATVSFYVVEGRDGRGPSSCDSFRCFWRSSLAATARGWRTRGWHPSRGGWRPALDMVVGQVLSFCPRFPRRSVPTTCTFPRPGPK